MPAAMPAEPMALPSPPPPWLLLSLGVVTLTSFEEGSGASTGGAGGDAVPEAGFTPLWSLTAGSLSSLPAASTVGHHTLPSELTPAESAVAAAAPAAITAVGLPASTTPGFDELGAAAEDWPAAPPPAAAAPGLSEELLLVDDAPTAPGSPVIGTQPAELLTRWRAATRAPGGDLATATPSVGEVEPEMGAGAEKVMGAAAHRLAQLLGQPAADADVGRVHAPGPAADRLGMVPGASSPETGASFMAGRTSEVLLRLAQADGRGAASHEGGAPNSLSTLGMPAVPMVDVRSASAATPVLPPAVAEQVVQQIVSALKMQWKDGIGEAKLQLRPDALGSVTVSLRVDHGVVTAVVRAESAQVQEWVLQHQQSLREQMEAAGLRLEELVVSPEDQRQREQEESSEPQRRRSRTPRGDADTAEAPRFELLV